MIDLFVTLNGEEFEVRAAGDTYNNELPDFNAAVQAALNAQFVAHPTEPLDSASLEVSVRRVYQDTAARDGVFDDPESPRSDLANEREAEGKNASDNVDGADAEAKERDKDSEVPKPPARRPRARQTRANAAEQD